MDILWQKKWPNNGRIFMNSVPPLKKAKEARTASKTTSRYWASKIFLEKKPGWESSNYFVRIQAHGIRRKMKLDSSVKEEAAREAVSIYLEVLSKGWPKEDENALVLTETSILPEDPTIEEWFNAVNSKRRVGESSIKKYFEALQTIVGEILGMPRARKLEQRSKIKKFPVSGLQSKVVQAWLDARITKSHKLDVVAQKKALNTARSILINAKSLFSTDTLGRIGVNSDSMGNIPFAGVKPPSKGQERYSSRIDARRVLAVAKQELGTRNPEDERDGDKFEQWKILYLAAVAGLRYNEIDQLRVHDIRVESCRIAINSHETFSTKTDASVGDVPVSKAAAEVLKAMLKQTKGSWFIADGALARSKYRAAKHHDAIIKWLRNYEERGVKPLAKVSKPLHELRKEAGSLVNQDHGLVATQHFLRHKSITTTAGVYVEAKGNVNTGLS
ncbi:MAG: site-specific integrase [Herbaspirillum sp.]